MKYLRRGEAPEPLIDVHTILSYGLGDISEPLIATLDGELWKEIGHESFASLVYTDHPYGWAINRSFLLLLTKDTPFLQERVKDELTDKAISAFEVDAVTKPLLVKGKETGRGADRSSNTTSNERGKQYIASRLARDNPELHEKVRKGELTLNKAAIQAGFRKPTLTIPHDPIAAVKALRRKYSADEIELFLSELLSANNIATIER